MKEKDKAKIFVECFNELLLSDDTEFKMSMARKLLRSCNVNIDSIVDVDTGKVIYQSDQQEVKE